ncbi:MAG: D-alanyl-D-alanine carboxypeptidase/D-alanyl-D-alanine-endopeptidase, partial [Acidimicrobiales bacterium]
NGPDLRYEHAPSTPLVPASTIKLLTATAALETLGADARFRTAVVSAAPAVDGVLSGDLTLVGGGDPLLATADYMARFRRQPQVFTDLDALAAAVQASGVRRIDGSVVGDERRYDASRYVASWPARYVDQDVIGPLSALAVNDGFERYPAAFGDGTPLDAAVDPPSVAAGVFTRLLEARGVDVVGPPRGGEAAAGATELAAIESEPLLEVVAQMLRESDNSTAELLLKELGRTAGSATTAAGATAVTDVAATALDEPQGLVVADGSGLSTDNRVTCDHLVELLGRPATGGALVDHLAVAGESGTLTERYRGSPLEGILRAKTGSLTSVSALAGVVADADPALTFALVVNVPSPARVPPGVATVEQQIVGALAAWPRTPDLADLGPLPGGA